MKRQSTLFPQDDVPVIAELDLKEAEKAATQIKSAVSPYCDKIEVAGSIRRQKAKVHDIDFVVATKTDTEWRRISEELRRLKAKPSCAGNSVIKALLPCRSGLFQVDFYRAKPSTFGILLLVRTGSAEHNVWLASYARSKGMRIKYSEGLLKEDKVVAGEDEQGIFAALGLPYPLPPQREVGDNTPVWMHPKEQ